MLVLFALIFISYCVMMILLIGGWEKALSFFSPKVKSGESELITVLIPVRNEEANIKSLLYDLQKQKDTFFEVLVIDDHSEDSTVKAVEEVLGSGFDKLRVVKLIDSEGKKCALTLGVRLAKGSIIVTTDADCRVTENWLATFRLGFADAMVKFVFGGVRIKQDGSLWSSVQATELASLIGSGVASSAFGYYTMCNGANLAYRKEVFETVNGYSGNSHIASGDDEFLLKKISAQFPESIRFLNDPESVVETNGVSIIGLVHQRVRWAGKWKHQDFNSRVLALIVFLFHLAFLIMVAWALWNHNFIWLLSFLTIKSVFELVFLRKVMRFLNSRWSWRSFLILELTYSLYTIFFGIVSNLKSPDWKGRKIRRSGLKISPGLPQNH